MKRKIALLLVLFCLSLGAQNKAGDAEILAPYYPTPETIVQKMLQMGELKAGEKMFDLGSGDGRIVIMAAEKFHANAVGVELKKDLYEESTKRIQMLKLQKTARIVNGDILQQDYTSADLITVYLLPISNDKIRPILDKQLKKGARIVSHDFAFKDWTPEKVETIDDDGEGRSHTIYLYRK